MPRTGFLPWRVRASVTATSAGLIDTTLGNAAEERLQFQISRDAAQLGSINIAFSSDAAPLQQGQTGNRYFCSDQSGVINFGSGNGKATARRPCRRCEYSKGFQRVLPEQRAKSRNTPRNGLIERLASWAVSWRGPRKRLVAAHGLATSQASLLPMVMGKAQRQTRADDDGHPIRVERPARPENLSGPCGEQIPVSPSHQVCLPRGDSRGSCRMRLREHYQAEKKPHPSS